MLPTKCSFPIKTLFKRFDVSTLVSIEDRLKIIKDAAENDVRPLDNVLEEVIESKLKTDNIDLLPYIFQKLWLGDQLVYSDEIEQRIEDVIESF